MADSKKLSVEIQTTATGDGAQKTAAGLEKVAGAAKNAASPINSSAKETENLADAVEKLGSRNNATKDAIEGVTQAARGGENAFFGLAKAARGVKEVFAGGLKFTGFGAAIAGITAFLSIIDHLKEKVAQEVEALKNIKNSAERLGTTYESLGKQAKASADKQVEELKRVADGFKELDELAGEARDRINALNDANKRRELAELEKATAEKLQRASTPAERERITADSAQQKQAIEDRAQRTQLDNQKLQANLEIAQSQERIRELQQRRQPAASDLSAAKTRASEARDTLESFRQNGGDINSKFGEELRDSVRVADKTVEELGKVLESVDREIGPQVQTLEARIRKAKTTLETNAIDRKTQSTEEATRKIGQVDSRQTRINELGQQAETAAAQGDFAAQDAAVAERKKLQSEVAKERAARAAKAPAARFPDDPSARSFQATGTSPATPSSSGADRAAQKVERAAEKVESAEPIKAEKISDSLDQLSEKFSNTLQQGQESIDEVASSVQGLAGQLPPPLDLSPIASSQITYHEAVISRFRQNEETIRSLASQISQLASQVNNSRQ